MQCSTEQYVVTISRTLYKISIHIPSLDDIEYLHQNNIQCSLKLNYILIGLQHFYYTFNTLVGRSTRSEVETRKGTIHNTETITLPFSHAFITISSYIIRMLSTKLILSFAFVS